ncbi:hypothetical protein CATRI_07875 [Corynebacterium atrinae]|uniref:hypothetical protein n=1 Tax=Corynebacterium atrinae TaxID=1336740 RepID=UPI0025B42A8B|nr:hypothetical protein [Corynebacterium atrinae]WJY63647.1 hypothetical protein CATRI_07875 [Corynebacterium atrinae]
MAATGVNIRDVLSVEQVKKEADYEDFLAGKAIVESTGVEVIYQGPRRLGGIIRNPKPFTASLEWDGKSISVAPGCSCPDVAGLFKTWCEHSVALAVHFLDVDDVKAAFDEDDLPRPKLTLLRFDNEEDDEGFGR